MNILVTGVAGFIGMAVARQLLKRGETVIGIDNLNNYYDTKLKFSRLNILKKYKKFHFYKVDILSNKINKIFKEHLPTKVIHLAAQPGIRYSILNPFKSSKVNIEGFNNIIEISKNSNVKHFVYASSSSVYGLNRKLPYKESHKVDSPYSLYAASKKSNELFAHAYSSLYKMKTSGIRYFTVYGPWGRPDMAAIKFLHKISNNKKINIYNKGIMKRDFTYIDDAVDGTLKILDSQHYKEYCIYNIGNSRPSKILNFVNLLEKYYKKKADYHMSPMQLGDLKNTHACLIKSKRNLKYKPKTNLEEGIKNLVLWYKDYYGSNKVKDY